MKWSVRNKLLASFTAITAFVGVLGYISYDRVNTVGELGIEIARHDRAAFLASQMHRELLEGRRREKDFFLRAGDPEYLEQFEHHVVAFVEAADALVLAHPENATREKVQDAKTLMSRYAGHFREAAQARITRGEVEDGRMGELRRAVHALEELVEASNDDSLLVSVLLLRRHEKDFLLRGGEAYVDKLVQESQRTRARIGALSVSQEQRMRMASLLDDYVRAFRDVVSAQHTVDAATEAFREAAQAVEPIVEEVASAVLSDSEVLQGSIAGEKDTAVAMILSALVFLVLLSVAISYFLSQQMALGVATLVDGANRIRGGDLETKIQLDSRDELGDLALGYDAMRTSLAELMRQLGTTSSSLANLAQDARAATTEQGAGLNEQSAAVSETMATVEELSRAATQVASRADEVVAAAASSVESSQQGTQALEQAIEGMQNIRDQVSNIASTILDLSQKTQQIGLIIATVNDIAEQSNLLALNASIEAARAGEQGKAFAVVAGEVRNLAERSQRATGQVRDILSDIQQTTNTAVMVTEEGSKRVDRGIDLVGGAGEVINELASTIEESARIAEQIAASTGQQAAGIKQISAAMSDLEKFATDNVSAISRIDDVAQELVVSSSQLDTMMKRYQVR